MVNLDSCIWQGKRAIYFTYSYHLWQMCIEMKHFRLLESMLFPSRLACAVHA